jgi:hypothetical protein
LEVINETDEENAPEFLLVQEKISSLIDTGEPYYNSITLMK